jgi:hypothetical protein
MGGYKRGTSQIPQAANMKRTHAVPKANRLEFIAGAPVQAFYLNPSGLYQGWSLAARPTPWAKAHGRMPPFKVITAVLLGEV